MLNKLSTKLSLKIFGQRKPLELVIFDKMFSKFIINVKHAKDYIIKFHEDGFVKIKPDISREIEIINQNLELEANQTNPPFTYKINEEINNAIEKILYVKMKNYFFDLENYFNSEIHPAVVHLKKNTYYKKVDENHENYSDNYHNDTYTLTHFKIFFNLMDVDENKGPMHIISKKNTKSFLNQINYKDRNNYNHSFSEEKLCYSNVGNKSDVLIFNPTQCFHRATIPKKEKFRDYLTITFVCVPKKQKVKEKILKNLSIYKYENNPLLKFAKPKGFIKSFKLFYQYF
tara:strand:- start:57 stop:917 length:861 start_codon:yes stop_codon:yes gene_type:complete